LDIVVTDEEAFVTEVYADGSGLAWSSLLGEEVRRGRSRDA